MTFTVELSSLWLSRGWRGNLRWCSSPRVCDGYLVPTGVVSSVVRPWCW